MHFPKIMHNICVKISRAHFFCRFLEGILMHNLCKALEKIQLNDFDMDLDPAVTADRITSRFSRATLFLTLFSENVTFFIF